MGMRNAANPAARCLSRSLCSASSDVPLNVRWRAPWPAWGRLTRDRQEPWLPCREYPVRPCRWPLVQLAAPGDAVSRTPKRDGPGRHPGLPSAPHWIRFCTRHSRLIPSGCAPARRRTQPPFRKGPQANARTSSMACEPAAPTVAALSAPQPAGSSSFHLADHKQLNPFKRSTGVQPESGVPCSR